jgi:type I restriction enzyme M protein
VYYGDDLLDHDRYALEKLGQEKGMLGLTVAMGENKFQDPAKLIAGDLNSAVLVED